ncbi:hypothetical protein SAMD00019534_097600, partial [Acytostelium subglobosum LB1]|uniref:hypothetical protein n=1 Tax=Acytostelium subglobosum LB1 TaxID=1410327 RepID=UPI00064518CF
LIHIIINYFKRMSAPHFVKYTKDLGNADPNREITFTIVMKLRNKEWIDQQKETSDPKSEHYGQYKSKEEVEKMTRPSQENFDRVIQYLKSHHQLDARQEGDNLKITTTIAKAQELFHTHIHKFGIPDSKNADDIILRREGNMTIPKDISDYVDLVVGF